MKTKKYIATLLLIALLSLGIIPNSAIAAVRQSDYLSSYDVWMTAERRGAVTVHVDINGKGIMDEIGTSRIVIRESNDGGQSWKIAAEFNKSDLGMYDNDSSGYFGSFVYQGTAGNLYKATVSIYAENSSGSGGETVITNSVTAIK